MGFTLFDICGEKMSNELKVIMELHLMTNQFERETEVMTNIL